MNETTDIKKTAEKTSPNKGGVAAGLFDYFEIIVFSIIAVLLLFTFCVRLCKVDGGSMKNTLQNEELLLTTNLFYEPKQGDVVVFHLVNNSYKMPLVKRVIATEGQTVLIDLDTGKVFVDGVLLDEPYVFLDGGYYTPNGYFNSEKLSRDEKGHLVFKETVPEGMLFVMGDNRNHSSESRSRGVGLIDKDCIMGKAILRLKPFTRFD